MGIVQPGGAGTPIYVYDDAVSTNHPAAPGPHTWAEINTAFPNAVALLKDAAGNDFSTSARQYLLVDPVVIGGQVTDGTNYTSIAGTDLDLFVRTTAAVPNYRYRSDPGISPSSIVTSYGTKIGSGRKAGGKQGITCHVDSGALILRGTISWNGGFIRNRTGALQLLNQGSTQQEFNGTTFDISGSMVLGNADEGPLFLYNCNFAYRGTVTAVSASFIRDAEGSILLATAPTRFFDSNSSLRRLRRLILSGTPTIAEVRMQSGALKWESTDMDWADAPGIPRIQFLGVHTVGDGDGLRADHWIDTKIVDETTGDALASIPVRIEDDVGQVLLNTQTQLDGNITFTWSAAQPNTLPVRDYYSLDGSTTLVRDRKFTITVNEPGGVGTPNDAYDTGRIVIEWPGRDRLGSGYQADGGSFVKAMVTIPLHLKGSWTECEVDA